MNLVEEKIEEIPGAISRVELDKLLKGHKLLSFVFAALTLTGSVITGVWVAGVSEGELRTQIAILDKSRDDMSHEMGLLNMSIVAFTASNAAASAKIDGLTMALEHERQDRINYEHEYRIHP